MARPAKPADEAGEHHSLHYIPDWAEKRNTNQADMVRALDVSRATVSRWFAGQMPAEAHLPLVAEYLHIEVADLFRHPDDNWLARLLNAPKDEREQIEKAIKTLMDRRVA